MADIEWNKSVWRRVQGHVMEIADEDTMQNSEIQDKILDIVKKHND